MSSRSRKNNIMRGWLVALGMPALCLAIGIGLMGVVDFTLGAVIAYIALLFLVWDWWRLMRRKKTLRALGSILMMGVVGWFSWLVFRPWPLEIDIKQVGSGYSLGEVGGIQWRPEYGDVRIKIANPTDKSYDDIDVVFDPSVEIMQMAELSNWTDVKFQPMPVRPGEISLNPVTIKDAVTVESMTLNHGEISAIEGHKVEGNVSIKQPILLNSERPSSSYRIVETKLQKHSVLEIIVAIARLNQPIAGQLPKVVFTSLGNIKCMRITGKYKVFNKDLVADSTCISN